MTPSQKPQDGGAAVRYEPHCDCLGGHVTMVPDPNGLWCRADDPRAVADDPSGIVQQMPEVRLRADGRCSTDSTMRHFAYAVMVPDPAGDYVEYEKARATEADLRAEVERLRGMIDSAANIFENCSVENGVCCCGDAMDNHSGLMHSNHVPVDQGAYVTDEWLKAYKSLYPETDGGQDG